MTWTYQSPMDSPEGIPDEWVWERLRAHRNRLIAECDWTQVADAPVDKVAWAAYRQALRDLPEVTADPRTADWPAPPA